VRKRSGSWTSDSIRLRCHGAPRILPAEPQRSPFCADRTARSAGLGGKTGAAGEDLLARSEGRRSVAGAGAAATKVLSVGESARGFLRCVESELNPVYPDLRWYGGIRFDQTYAGREPDRRWEAFGNGLFLLPRFELVADGTDAQLVCNILTDGTDRDRRFEILDQLQELRFDIDREPEGSCERSAVRSHPRAKSGAE